MLELVRSFVQWVLNVGYWCGPILGGLEIICFIIGKIASIIKAAKKTASEPKETGEAVVSGKTTVVCGDTERLASCGRRFLARTVDGYFFGTLSALVLLLAIFPWLKWTANQSTLGPGQIKERLYFYNVVLALFFEGGFWALLKTTPGKWLFGIRVLEEDGLLASGGKYALRMFSIFVWVFCWGLGAVLPHWAGLCMLRQAYVVHKSPINRTSYDEELHLNVVSRPLTTGRILLIVLAVVGMAILQYAAIFLLRT
jgi:uncharacterized RDD family membrane protein YckC